MTPLFANPNLVGLALQAAAVLMIAAMCFTLLKTSPRSPLVAWTAAWIALFVALMVLLLAFRTPVVGRWLQPVYMYFEYVFAYLLFAGCREYATGRRLENRDGWMALVMLIPAIALPAMARWQFNIFYPFHSLLYAYLFFISLRQMARAKATTRGRAGLRVMKVALSVLTLMYTAYAPVFAAASTGWISANPAFLAFSPLYDMLALTLLGFGVVMVTSGDVHSDLERARDLLAGAAQQDPLTSAFNRHAFYAVLDRDLSGTAVFADIDNLKSINDQFGHAAGDAAIRACARALRSHIRADDLLFRWGGDEFLVLLLGVAEADARRRLAGVNDELRHVVVHDEHGEHGKEVEGADLGITVSISMGFAPFNSAASLDDVIRVADTAMYGIKRRRIG